MKLNRIPHPKQFMIYTLIVGVMMLVLLSVEWNLSLYLNMQLIFSFPKVESNSTGKNKSEQMVSSQYDPTKPILTEKDS